MNDRSPATISLDDVWAFIPTLIRAEANIVRELMRATEKTAKYIERDTLRFAASGRVHTSSNLVSVHISRIKKKLPPTHAIETHTGRGYRLVEKSNG